jgi:hypothetical protein
VAGRCGLLPGVELLFLLRKLLLAFGEGGLLLPQVGHHPVAVAVCSLELVQARLGGLLALGRERLLGCGFGLHLRDPRVLGLDRRALVADASLALLQLDLELRQLRLTLVEGGGTVGELLLRADVLVVRL